VAADPWGGGGWGTRHKWGGRSPGWMRLSQGRVRCHPGSCNKSTDLHTDTPTHRSTPTGAHKAPPPPPIAARAGPRVPGPRPGGCLGGSRWGWPHAPSPSSNVMFIPTHCHPKKADRRAEGWGCVAGGSHRGARPRPPCAQTEGRPRVRHRGLGGGAWAWGHQRSGPHGGVPRGAADGPGGVVGCRLRGRPPPPVCRGGTGPFAVAEE